jgi:transposase InsO family protein
MAPSLVGHRRCHEQESETRVGTMWAFVYEFLRSSPLLFPYIVSERKPEAAKSGGREAVRYSPKSPSLREEKERETMTLSYYADRVNLVHAMRRFPDWSVPQLAHALARSPSWVKKWRKRLRPLLGQPAALQAALAGQSRARKKPPAKLDSQVEEAILQIRDQPPEGLRRTPGPKAIQYYLQRDEKLEVEGLARSYSTRTIYQVLVKHQRITQRKPREPEPMERPEPMSHWQIDYKDIFGLLADLYQEKKQHGIQAFNIVDMGTSQILAAHVRADFTAETSLKAMAESLQAFGLPSYITIDRDTRLVGSPQGSDFPSAFLRFCACLHVKVKVCDPHHPQQNGFVERYNRSYKEECLRVDRPRTLEQAQEATAKYCEHYNWQRPNQAISCGNRPPRTAFPDLPELPPVPQQVDPDAWLLPWHGHHFQRKVDASGGILIDMKRYGVGKLWRGRRVTVTINALEHQLHVYVEGKCIKTLPLRGVVGRMLSYEEFVEHMAHQARAQHRLLNWQERRRRTSAEALP